MLFFIHSINGNSDLSCACRMANDAHKVPERNSVMKVVPYMGKAHLCLFATLPIACGQEIRYDYGDTQLPWRKRVTCALIFGHQ